MASPTIVGTVKKTSVAASTSHEVDLPSTVNDGEILLLVGSTDGSVRMEDIDADWEIGFHRSDTTTTILYAWHRADGTEGGVTVTVTLEDSEPGKWMVWRIANCAGIFSSYGSTGSDTSPDPPAISLPTALDVLTIALMSSDGNKTCDAYPSGYSYAQDTIASGGTAESTLGFAAKQETGATSSDPGAFTISASDGWAALTLYCLPSSGVWFGRPAPQDLNQVTVRSGATAFDYTSVGQTYWGKVSTTAYKGSIRFPSCGVPQGATITKAYVGGFSYGGAKDTCNATWDFNDVDDAAVPTTYQEYDALAHTSANASWSGIAVVAAYGLLWSTDIASPFAEVIARVGYEEGNAVQVLFADNSSSSDAWRAYYVPASTVTYGQAPWMLVVYTVGGTPQQADLEAAHRTRSARAMVLVATITAPLEAAHRVRTAQGITFTLDQIADLDAAHRIRTAVNVIVRIDQQVALEAAVRARTAQDVTLKAVFVHPLEAAHRVRSAQDMTIVGGAVTYALEAATRTRTALDATLKGSNTIALEAAHRTRAAQGFILRASIVIPLDAAHRTRSGMSMVVVPGEVVVALDAAVRQRTAVDMAAAKEWIFSPDQTTYQSFAWIGRNRWEKGLFKYLHGIDAPLIVVIKSGVALPYPGVSALMPDDWAAADSGRGKDDKCIFVSGHVYWVTQEQKDALVAAGYTVTG